MLPPFPITLKGTNLGARHRYLNILVADAFRGGESLEIIIAQPESSPVDRLFKIDLASKHKNVEYILKNLRDDDMLYVSRALRQSKWLLSEEYRQIIDAAYLEDVLYPEMTTTAVNKMKHWIYLNLNDSVRCLHFYEYYREKNFDFALKFLCKCPEDTILNEFPKKITLNKITPQYFKILCERIPTVAKLFFEILKQDSSLFRKYSENMYLYDSSIKCILKQNSDLYMDIIEEHFMIHFKRLSTIATSYILTHKKDRFLLKSELYTSRILNVETLAQCLTEQECENLIIKLARSRFLKDKEYWFNYKNVEPLIKRLDVNMRANFKKKVFVDKDFGEVVDDWPYTVPEFISVREETDVFVDENESPDQYDRLGDAPRFDEVLMRCGMSCPQNFASKSYNRCIKTKTLLNSLFDEYRFISFDKALFELRKKITSESSAQTRMFMMLVLVSKSGGREENLEALVKLLIKHHNEPSQIRASIIRSLVKRACVWRVREDIWKDLLIFGRGLGLNGETPEADCDEGLHAVVIRALLSGYDLDPPVKKSFINFFSTFTAYSLTGEEKKLIKKVLLKMLLEIAIEEKKSDSAVQILGYVVDTIQAYKITFDSRLDIVASIKNLINKYKTEMKDVLKRLYDSKLGRKEFIRENFDNIQTDAAYVNALKHDVTILSVDKFLKGTVSGDLTAEQFLRKINIYFNENEGLSKLFLFAIKKHEVQKELARPLAHLLGTELKSYILEIDTTNAKAMRFSARIRANAHLARPSFDINSLEWRKMGAKLISNKVLICRTIEVDHFINHLLSWKRTARLAIILAQRTNYEDEVFADVAKLRPSTALKCALSYFRRKVDQSNLHVWKIVKPFINNVKESCKTNRYLLNNITKVGSMPMSIRPEYATEVYKAIKDINFNKSMTVLCHICLVLPKIEVGFIETVLQDFIENRYHLGKTYGRHDSDLIVTLFSNILGRYLLLCKTEQSQIRRFEKIGQLYLNSMQSNWESGENRKFYFKHLNAVIRSFKYYEVFLNEEYVSCLPVMEKFVEWMKSILPVEKYFDTYVPLHLTMLYYKVIRQTTKQMPEVFANEETRRTTGNQIVGETFGKFIAQEAQILTKNYFDSIVVLYNKVLVQYIRGFNRGKYRMIPYMIKGIVDVSNGVDVISALELYYDNDDYLSDDDIDIILKCLREKKLIELQFCFTKRLYYSRYQI